MVTAFISYAHADEEHRRALETHLSLLRRKGVLHLWTDRRIGVGDEWKSSINQAVESADLFLILVSADLLASDYCWDEEMARAIERHREGKATVVPIFVRPCDWADAPFARFQGAPRDAKAITSWANRDEAWADVATALRRWIDSRNPR